MSGKSSFMRTIGVNLVLMYAGTYVNAEKFCAPFMRIFTSIGVQDDISRGISTFYGELLRIKKVLDYAENTAENEVPFIVFIDEIHRFNKGQQDLLLPYVEDGTIILIGATTENPYFEINRPLLSRVRLIHLNALPEKAEIEILRRALTDKVKGLGNYGYRASDDVLSMISSYALSLIHI